MIVTGWSGTQIEVSRRIAEKGKELTIATTRVEQYWNIEDHNSNFDHREWWHWSEEDYGV